MHSIQRYMLIGPALLLVAAVVVFFVKKQAAKPNTPYRQLIYASTIERELSNNPEATKADWLNCIAAYERVFEKWPESDEVLEAYRHIGTIYKRRLRDREEAKAWYARVIKEFPDSEVAEGVRREYAALAMSFADTDEGRLEALAAYTDYIEHNPDSAELDELLLKRGRLLAKLRRPDEAIADFERIVAEFPEGSRADDAVFFIGLVYEGLLGDTDRALEQYEKILKDYSKSNQIRVALKHKEQIWERRVEKLLDDYFTEHYGLQKASMYFVSPRALYRIESADDDKRVKAALKQTLDLTSASLEVDLSRGGLRVTGSLVIANPSTIEAEEQGEKEDEGDAEDEKKEEEKTPSEATKVWLTLNEGMELRTLTQGGTALEFKRHKNLVKVKLAKPIAVDGETTLDFTVAKKGETPGIVIGEASGYAFPDAFWFPVTRLDDAYSSRITFRFPAAARWTLVSNGTGATTGAFPGMQWECGSPMPGRFFVYGRHRIERAPWGDRTLLFLLDEKTDRAAVLIFLDEAVKAADFLLGVFGTYPPDKIVFARSPDVRETVFEHGAGLILINDRVPIEKIKLEHICNELVQQWYGCLVYPALGKWLSYTAGPASYYEALYLGQRYDSAAMEAHLAELRKLYREIFEHIRERALVFRPDEQSEGVFDGLVYTKGAWALHVIRWIAGDEHFVNAQRAFFEKFAFRPVTLKDLRESFDEVTGEKMYYDVFFGWFFNAGTPALKVEKWTTTKVGEEYEVTFTLAQAAPKYVLPVELAFEAGAQRIVETARITKTVVKKNDKENDEGNGKEEKAVWNETFTFTLPFDPERIVLDPNDRILLNPKSERVWTKPGTEEPAADEPAEASD